MKDYISHLVLGGLGVLPEELKEAAEKTVWGVFLELLSCDLGQQRKRRRAEKS